ncbi:MAG: hypothetical protein HY558_00755 [Euryarchaeota archaeon]|nr:hypothetical protein [Euryarchaeota archaeon]
MVRLAGGIFMGLGVALYFAMGLLLPGSPVRDYGSLVLLFLGVQVVLKDVADVWVGRVFKPYSLWWKVLLAPGTVVHEVSHLVGVVAMGCRVKEFVPFKPDPETGTLGYVAYVPPRGALALPRDLVIGLAPLFGCGLVTLGILLVLAPGSLQPGVVRAGSFGDLFSSIVGVAGDLLGALGGLPLKSWTTWVLFYLLLCFGFGAAPSTPDFKNPWKTAVKSPLSIGVLALLVFLFLFFGERFLFVYRWLLWVSLLSVLLLGASLVLLAAGSRVARLPLGLRAAVAAGILALLALGVLLGPA